MTYKKDSLLDVGVLNDPEQVRAAIDAGADVGARDELGWAALHWCSNQKSVRLLIEAGADVNARTRLGGTPLHSARTADIALALLEAGADWTIKNWLGSTAVERDREVSTGVVAQAIEQWVAAHEHAGSMSDELKDSETQQGPGL